MKTTLTEGLRVYMVVTSTGKQMFCHIEDLNQVVKYLECNPGYFKVFHFWNNKQVKLSKKDLKQMFEGSQLKQEFNY